MKGGKKLSRFKVLSIIFSTLLVLQMLVPNPKIFAETPLQTQQNDSGNIEVESKGEDIASFMPMAIGTPGHYPTDPNSIVVPTTMEGSSTNNHTMPALMWSNGDTVYVAVKSTHPLQYLTLNGATTSVFDDYNSWVPIYVENEQYDPTGLTGNTGSSHWTVFKFKLTDLKLLDDGKYPFFIKGQGGGHDVGGNLLIMIPKMDITGKKVWVGGTARPGITLQLKAQVNNEQQKIIASGVVNGTENPAWAFKWNQVPKYDPYGRPYTYSIDEETVPPNYVKTLEGLTVTNTYQPTQINIEVKKVWIGPTKESVTIKLYGNGADTGKTLVLNQTNGWSGSFSVNKYDDSGGKEISYTVKEAEVPYGYQVSYSTEENGRIIVTNTAIEAGKVTVKYVDEDGNEIADSVVHTGYIGETYKTEQKDIPGYEFKEMHQESASVTGEFKKDPQTVIYVYKKKLGSLTISKVDADHHDKLLEGALFELYDSENNLVDKKTTDVNGQIVFENLEWGEYTLIETKAPEGYRKLIEKISVKITKDELHVTKTVKNAQIDWEIPKTGGIGTLVFYGLGGLLMASAFLWFVLRRRQV